MRPSDFIVLSEQEKKFTVLHAGVLIGKRASTGFIVFLFQLEGYYVETYCNRSSKVIEEYRIFDNSEALSPYLELISLEGLVN